MVAAVFRCGQVLIGSVAPASARFNLPVTKQGQFTLNAFDGERHTRNVSIIRQSSRSGRSVCGSASGPIIGVGFVTRPIKALLIPLLIQRFPGPGRG
jgi:hypothetical protein